MSSGKGSRRRPEDYAKVAANWPKRSARCVCGSFDVKATHFDEDIPYGDGVMAAEWVDLECLRCGEMWRE